MEGVTVREILTREYVGVSESDTVSAAVDLMLEEGALTVVVLRGTDPVGMLTASDALALLADDADTEDTAVGDVMSRTVPTVRAGASLAEAAGHIADEDVGAVLVTDGDEVFGIVSRRDVVRATASLAGESVAADTVGEPAVAGGPTRAEPTETNDVAGDAEYSRQSVCEICGSLTRELRNFNGQLICDDCREV